MVSATPVAARMSPAPKDRRSGELIDYDPLRGYGWLRYDDGSPDVYVHARDVPDQGEQLLAQLKKAR